MKFFLTLKKFANILIKDILVSSYGSTEQTNDKKSVDLDRTVNLYELDSITAYTKMNNLHLKKEITMERE